MRDILILGISTIAFAVCSPVFQAHANCLEGERIVGEFDRGSPYLFSLKGSDQNFGLADVIVDNLDKTAKKMTISHRVEIVLSASGSKPEDDRYGRLLGQILIDGQWLQRRLLLEGSGLLAPQLVNETCLGLMRGFEKQAEFARMGLWEKKRFPLKASDLKGLAGHEGQLAVIEGKVLSIGDRKSRLYLNFGHDWSKDFTVTAQKKGKTAYNGLIDQLQALKGKVVRVRGIIEMRGGPMIRLTHRSQIEMDQ